MRVSRLWSNMSQAQWLTLASSTHDMTVDDANFRQRTPKTSHFQVEVIEAVEKAHAQNVAFTQATFARQRGITPGQVSTWMQPATQMKSTLMVAAVKGRRELIGGRGASLPSCENQLSREFYDHRVYQGLRVSHKWLRRHLLEILTIGWEKANCGWSWASGFCKHYLVSDQVKTNSKMLPIGDRIPRIQRFHTWLIYGMQFSEVQRCDKYGHFP
jgi:hypothetical protein